METPPDRIWELIIDVNRISKIIPDLREYEVIDGNRAKALFGIGLGLIRGTMKMILTIQPIEYMRSAKIVGEGDGMQSNTKLSIDLVLESKDSSTKVQWAANVNITGLLSTVGKKLLTETTRAKIIEIVENIRKMLEERDP